MLLPPAGHCEGRMAAKAEYAVSGEAKSPEGIFAV